MSSPIIQIRDLSKSYIITHEKRESYTALRDVMTQKAKKIFSFPFSLRNDKKEFTKEEFWALKNISFDVQKGERVGIIGRNGAGKSTLLKILSRITEPTQGQIKIKGRLASLLEVGTGFHPELTGRENIFLNGAILGMSRNEIKKHFDAIVNFSEVEKFLDTPVKRYSSGMYVRLAFAVAAHLEPEILVVDEVLAVGDAKFQKKCLNKMQDVSENEGRTVLFVSHNMTAIKQLCDNCIILRNGILSIKGDVTAAINEYISTDTVININKKWAAGDAPSNEFLRIREVFMHYPDGSIPLGGNFDITEKIGVTVKYTVLKEGHYFIHGANFYNNEDLNIFNSHDVTSAVRNEKRQPGEYEATMWIPGNLLSEGTFSASIAFFNPSPFEMFVNLDRIVSFNIVDDMKGNSARGNYTHGFPGVVRPLLIWEAKKI